jgi:hypothetical protein
VAALVTADEVREIIDDTTIPTALIDICILGANGLTDVVFSGDTEVGTVLLKEIQRWLVAHMVASTPNYRTTAKEKVGDAEVTYTGKWDVNLLSTTYGQMAIQLDITGKLQKYSSGKIGATLRAVKSFD